MLFLPGICYIHKYIEKRRIKGCKREIYKEKELEREPDREKEK